MNDTEKRLARVKKQSIQAKKERENLRAQEGDSAQNVVSSILSKRKYASQLEMEKDFWEIHYAKENHVKRPSERLWQKMHQDRIGSLAGKLWNNQYRMLNSGRIWLPCHGPTVRALFG